MIETVMAQVIALRAQIEALASTVEAWREHQPIVEAVGCRHLDVEEVGTFGASEKRCKSCGEVVL